MDDDVATRFEAEAFTVALKFYDDRAIRNKRWHRIASIYVIVVAAGLSPFIAFSPQQGDWRLAASILTASIVVVTSLSAHFKFHENWLAYRAAWDALNREKSFRNAGVGDYKNCADPHALFVERVEAIRSREGSEFYARHQPSDASTSKPSHGKARG